jgi:hypothetical protein
MTWFIIISITLFRTQVMVQLRVMTRVILLHCTLYCIEIQLGATVFCNDKKVSF